MKDIQTTGESPSLNSFQFLTDLKDLFKPLEGDNKRQIELHNIFLDHEKLFNIIPAICSIPEYQNAYAYNYQKDINACILNITSKYYEFIHKFITYIIFNGNKLYALDYFHDYTYQTEHFYSLNKIFFDEYDYKFYTVSNYVFNDINEHDDIEHDKYINLYFEDINDKIVDPSLKLKKKEIDIRRIFENDINIYKKENTNEYLLVDIKLHSSWHSHEELLDKSSREYFKKKYNPFKLDFFNIINTIESDDYFRKFRDNNEDLLKRMKLLYKIFYDKTANKKDFFRIVNYKGGRNKTTYKLYTNKKTNLAYINYNNKKSYFYENDNKIYIKIDDKIVYLTKKSISYDEKLNSYFVKL